MAKQSAGIPATKRAQLVLYPPKRSVWDMLMHSSSADAQTEAVLSRAGLEPLRAAWKDARLRVWMKGGMLRMMPFAISFK
jgi:hypothetical protein